MNVILILLLASLAVAGGFLIAFLWAVRTGQFDDTHTPGMRAIHDEKKKTPHTSVTTGDRDGDQDDKSG
jgi:cbb3-type cytochrome oxidase maturation protein